MYASMHAKESANCSETIFVQLIKINFDAIDIDDLFFDSIEKKKFNSENTNNLLHRSGSCSEIGFR